MAEINSTVSVDDLLKRFEEVCIEQYDTYLTDDIEKYNKDFEILVSIKDELKARGSEARRALLRLLSNDNPQVRLQAAKFVYPVARDEAKKCLQDIEAAKLPDQSLSAGMALHRLEEVPDCFDH